MCILLNYLSSLEGQRHDMHTGKNEEWSRKIGSEQKYVHRTVTIPTVTWNIAVCVYLPQKESGV